MLNPAASENEIRYRHLTLTLDRARRLAELRISGPSAVEPIPADAAQLGADWYPLRLFRELDDALLRLRFNHPEIGVVAVRSAGSLERVRELDHQLYARRDDYFVNEVLLLMRRALKRMDLTAKSFFALVDEESCFGGFTQERRSPPTVSI